MRQFVREALVTAAAAVCLAGPVAAVVISLSPQAWRGPALTWAILLGSVALVARLRRLRRRDP